MTIPDFTLNDGHRIPGVGFGTWPMRGDEAIAGTSSAIEAGYRLIDTAFAYENEEAVGEAVRRSGIRDELTITTKVPGPRLGYDDAIASATESRSALGVDRIDLLLIHGPNADSEDYRDAWRAFVDLRDRGVVRSIGVSNFSIAQLSQVIDDTGVVPAVNQVRLHPYHPETELHRFQVEKGIVTESYSPLGLNPRNPTDLLKEPVIVEIAVAHGISPAQAVLRWHVQLGLLPIPKSGDPQRQRENLDVFGFELDDAELEAISALERSGD